MPSQAMSKPGPRAMRWICASRPGSPLAPTPTPRTLAALARGRRGKRWIARRRERPWVYRRRKTPETVRTDSFAAQEQESRLTERNRFDVEAYIQSTQARGCFICGLVSGDPDFAHHVVFE